MASDLSPFSTITFAVSQQKSTLKCSTSQSGSKGPEKNVFGVPHRGSDHPQKIANCKQRKGMKTPRVSFKRPLKSVKKRTDQNTGRHPTGQIFQKGASDGLPRAVDRSTWRPRQKKKQKVSKNCKMVVLEWFGGGFGMCWGIVFVWFWISSQKFGHVGNYR